VPRSAPRNAFLTAAPPGLSPSIHSIDQIKVMDRFRGFLRSIRFLFRVFNLHPEVPHDGPMADLVW
jgi:diadenosine tetraphosphatase ApaH/serine/threonine PP2A family protein phosphatase